MKKIYTAIDIGSDTIKFVVGEYFKNKLNILATYEQKAKGIRKGLIVDPNLAINSIKDGIKEINNNFGRIYSYYFAQKINDGSYLIISDSKKNPCLIWKKDEIKVIDIGLPDDYFIKELLMEIEERR